jgi:Ca2+-binding EF-hand superfamily protein
VLQEKVLRHAEELFKEADVNCDGKLSSDELRQMLLLVRHSRTCVEAAHMQRT